MPKDSQVDNKNKRKEKSNGQASIAKEAQNKSRNNKKQSIKGNDV